ncbi:MAG: ABC transporter substrate-binding protein [Lachnospiraceae bacterium]|nr:ABC transporter substrate-binding protein [Lachnospiraceae bacterium]
MNQKVRRFAAAALGTALAASALAGCGGSGSSSTTGAASGGASASTTGSTATYGGTANVVYQSGPATLFLPYSTSTGDRFYAAPAIESLGRPDTDGNMEGWLADSFDIDADNLTATVTLKKGIKFSDGTDFNADSVIWNFDKMIDGGKASELGTPDSYEKVDDYTVKLQYGSWANNWSTLLGQVYIYDPKAFDDNGEDWAAINAVGTGPFIMEEYVPGDHITYTKNENYWQEGKPYVDSINIPIITDTTTQQAAITNGEIDFLNTSNATLIQTLNSMGIEDIAQDSPDLAEIKYIMFASGDEDSPFYDEAVRKAVMHAIDWDGYVQSLTGGLGIKTAQFGVPGAWSYDDSIQFPEYNVDEAKSELAAAGYPNGFDTTITTISSNNDIAVLLQASLKAIGINAEIKTLENSEFNAEKKEGVYDGGIITGQGASKMDFTANYIRLYSSKGVNYLNMMAHPEDYETALFGAQAAKTLDEKKTLLKEASRLLTNEHALVVPVAATYACCYSSGKFVDSGIYQTADSVVWTPEDLKLAK